MIVSGALGAWLALSADEAVARPDLAPSPLSDQLVRERIQRANDLVREGKFPLALQSFQSAVRRARHLEPTERHYLITAMEMMGSKDYSDARDLLEGYLAEHPDTADMHFVLGQIHVKLASHDAAQREFTRALKIDPMHLQAAIELWKLVDAMRDYATAARVFGELAHKAPKSSTLQLYNGLALARRGYFEKAVGALVVGLQLEPERALFYIHNELVNAAKETRGLEGTIEIYEDLVANHWSLNAVVMLAKLRCEHGNIPRGAQLLEQIEGSQDELEDHRYLIGEISEECAEAIEEHGYSPEGVDGWTATRLYELGARHLAREKAAREATQGDAEGQDTLHRVTFFYGKLLVQAGRYQEGIKQLKNAERIWWRYRTEPPLAETFQLGIAHYRAGRKNEAEVYLSRFDMLVKSNYSYTDPETLELLADIYTSDGRYGRAAELLKRAMEVAEAAELKDVTRIRAKLVAALVELPASDEAALIECVAQAKKLVGNDEHGTAARLALARSYIKKGDAAMAVADLRDLEETDHWNHSAATLMARALLTDGEAEQSLRYVEQAREDDEDAVARALLHAEVLRKLRRWDEAEAVLRHVVSIAPSSANAEAGLGEVLYHKARDEATDLSPTDRVDLLAAALEHYQTASSKSMGNQLSELEVRIAQAEGEKLAREEKVQAESERQTTMIVALVVLLLALCAVLPLLLYLRERAANKCKDAVLALEGDLKRLIRDAVFLRWGGDWDRLGTKPFNTRVALGKLRQKAGQEAVQDLTRVMTFGELVGLIEVGWEELGLRHLERRAKLRIVTSSLEYISICRNAMFHWGLLDQQLEHSKRRWWQPWRRGSPTTAHMNRHVMHSIKTVRANLFRESIETPSEETVATVIAIPIPADGLVPSSPTSHTEPPAREIQT